MQIYDYRIYHLSSHGSQIKERILAHCEKKDEAVIQFNAILKDFMKNRKHKIGDMLILRDKNKVISSVQVDISINNNCCHPESNRIIIRHERKYL